MANEFQYDVFLSHSAKDKAVVRPLAERLRKDGLKVWFDEWVLKPGDSIPAKIEEGLEHSRVLVLCMSAHAFGSDWAQLEAGTFRFRDPLNKERRLIPLRLDDAPIKGSLAQFLYINWLPADREQEYAKLVEACRKPDTWPILEIKDSRRVAHSPGRYILVLSGTVQEMQRARVEAIANHLRLLTNDFSLTIERVEEGSVKLLLLGSHEGYQRLRGMAQSGQLASTLGRQVLSIGEFNHLHFVGEKASPLARLTDKYLPWVYRAWRRWSGGVAQTDPPGAQSYLEEFWARIANSLREKTYLPLEARPCDSFLQPIHSRIRLLERDATGGNWPNSEIPAVNRRSRPVRNLLRTLDQSNRPLILLGDPGSGKTTTLETAAMLLAQRERRRAFPLIPIYVYLGDFYIKDGPVTHEHVMAYVSRFLPPTIAPHLYRLAEGGRLVIFFDGMDEMSRDRYNDHVEALSFFASRYSQQRDLLSGIEGTKTLFSCRIAAFSPRFMHERLVLLPLDRQRIHRFLQEHIRSSPVEVDGRFWTLAELSTYLASKSLTVDATNPFFLQLLCAYLLDRKKWPSSRMEMLRFCNQLNYKRKNDELQSAGKPLLPPIDTTFMDWGWIAYEITTRNRGASIPVSILTSARGRPAIDGAIEAGKLCGVLRESKEGHEHLLRFNHHWFQEDFTALYIDKARPEIA